MKKLQKFRVQFNEGKEVKKEAVGKPKSIIDSVADELELTSKASEQEAKAAKGVGFFDKWVEVKAKKATEKKEAPKAEPKGEDAKKDS